MTTSTGTRPSLAAWRLAVFAVFAINGFAMASWFARTPAIRDALEVRTDQFGVLIMGMAAGSIAGLLASSHIIARIGSRATILVEGMHSAHLFTVLSGWAFRYKLLPDGRRQIMNYVLPGDLIGLQGSLMGEMDHSVEALTPVTLCVFERSKLERLFERHASLAYDLTWIAAHEERILDEHLLSIGRRTALERTAYLLSFIHQRAHLAGVNGGRRVLPITQQHVADTLGLSLVHTNKTLKRLYAANAIRWKGRTFELLDRAKLMELAGGDIIVSRKRPFI